MRLVVAFAGALLALTFWVVASEASTSDPFLWLEDAKSPRALEWVHAQNQQTMRALEGDAAYAKMLAESEAIVAAKDRIPYGTLGHGYVYNFWQDETHQRGIWRRAKLDDYRDGDPDWQTLIDLDKLSAAEHKALVWKGADCLPPDFARCLIKLSEAANDTVEVREFSTANKAFMLDGFAIGQARTEVSWVDRDTLIVATGSGKAALTTAGAPRLVKLWHRGEPLIAAKTVYECAAGDFGVRPLVEFDPAGAADTFVVRNLAPLKSQIAYIAPNGYAQDIAIPQDLEFKALYRHQLIFQALRDWSVGPRTFVQGALVSFSLDDYLANPGALPDVKPLFVPDRRTAVAAVAVARDAVYLSVLDNVRGRIHEVTFDGKQWFWRRLILPDNGGAEIVSASPADSEILIKYTSFLTPDRLYLTTKGNEPEEINSLPERFDADDFEVSQFEATSADGTHVPYFLVAKRNLKRNGTAPTLLYAYGGFQVSTTPWYWSTAGKLWLEKGGAYAVANVRGGGEFGPRWHEAVIGDRRQRSFDDLAAVARDLIDRHITAPRKLGMIGSSQGGLLTTGTFVQNPDLFNAVSAQVPLTDMLRYTHFAGGTTLIGEYGNPDDPRQRASISQWSPYQNVRPGVSYARPFFLSATRDRIPPAHARKIAAKFDALGQPYLYYETTDGPDATSTQHQRAEQLALTYTYFRQQLME